MLGNVKYLCEICDSDIGEVKNIHRHMLSSHNMTISQQSSLLYICHECPARFFTDEGFCRHLIASHGLVTEHLSKAAKNGRDGGYCPICGDEYLNKILHHLSQDHKIILKTVNLLIRCTVCKSTFEEYKFFYDHLYSVHCTQISVSENTIMAKENSLESTKNTQYLNPQCEEGTLPTSSNPQLTEHSTMPPHCNSTSNLDIPVEAVQELQNLYLLLCEICDDIVGDLTTLRNHMSDIHHVLIQPNINPSIVCNNCFQCFFTTEGYTRHLLGFHGIVTKGLQRAAEIGKDGGRCPICREELESKLIIHLVLEHNINLILDESHPDVDHSVSSF